MRIRFGLELDPVLPEPVRIIDPADEGTPTCLMTVFNTGQMPGIFVLFVEINKVVRYPKPVAGGLFVHFAGQRSDGSIIGCVGDQTVYGVPCFAIAMKAGKEADAALPEFQ